MKTLAIVFTLLLLPTYVHAASVLDGNQLLVACTKTENAFDGGKKEPLSVGLCMGLVDGVYGMLEHMNILALLGSGEKAVLNICLPKKSISTEKQIRIVTSYLRNEEDLNHPSVSLIFMALGVKYRCK